MSPDAVPAPASAKRTAIVQAGRELMLRHGIRKTRVEEVCADARVSKRTFYRYFRDKDELAVTVLAEMFEAGRDRIEAVLATTRPLAEQLWQVLDVKEELAELAAAAFYREVLDATTAPGRFVLQQRRAWDARIRQLCHDARAEGRIRDDVDPDVLVALLVRARDLVNDPAVAASPPEAVRVARMVTTVLLHGILPR